MSSTNTIKKAIAIVVAFAAYGAAKAAQTAPAHLTSADAIVTKLRTQGQAGQFTDAQGMPLNHYGASWANAFAIWGPTARVDAQCSSFVTLVMQNAYVGWTAKKAGFTSASPTAAMYHDAIESNTKGFKKVGEFEDALPGDFLMAKYFDDSANSGHAMIVRSAAIVDTNPATGITTWSIQVIDCSSGVHSNDTREFVGPNGGSFETNGAGRGTMRVRTKNGDIVDYSWSFKNGSILYKPSTRHLTLGRLSL